MDRRQLTIRIVEWTLFVVLLTCAIVWFGGAANDVLPSSKIVWFALGGSFLVSWAVGGALRWLFLRPRHQRTPGTGR